jgi:hypothetical protein
MPLSTILPGTANSRLKFYTNIKLQDATPRIEDSINIYMKEATTPKQQKLPKKPELFKTSICELKTFQLSKNLFEHTR